MIATNSQVSEKPRKPRKKKKEREEGKPKRPATAFMLWLNNTREKIKEENPGIAVTEIAKKGGEMWKTLESKSVSFEGVDQCFFLRELENFSKKKGKLCSFWEIFLIF